MPGYKVNSKRGLFDYQMSKQPLKNVVSMLIKDKDITSYQLFLIKQDRVLVLASLTSFVDYTVVNLVFFSLFEKNGSVGRWEMKHFIGMALLPGVFHQNLSPNIFY